MDNAEAIEYLKHADVTVGQEIKTPIAEALEMGIKALEQIDAIKKIISSDIYIQEDVMRYKMICDVVK